MDRYVPCVRTEEDIIIVLSLRVSFVPYHSTCS